MKSEIQLTESDHMSVEIPEKILAIWGRTLLKSGWSSIPNELLKNQAKLELSNTELVLIIHLISFIHNADSKIYPSIKLLSQRMNQDRRTIQRNINKLVKMDILRVKIRSTSKKDIGMTNLYDLTPLMRKLISINMPSIQMPMSYAHHVCPHCGKVAKTAIEIEKEFGVRRGLNGKVITQSWCRSCRGKKSDSI